MSSDDPPRRHPIAITGMHRSGTSMITRGLHESGLHLIGGDADSLLEAAEDNPEGFWENKAIVACNDDLLEATGGAWDNPPDLLPLAVDDPRTAEVVDAARAALDGLRENPHWGFKDPRLCLTAAFWLDLEPSLRFVICVRHPLEVALSLKRRNQNSYSLGLALWERYYAAVLDSVPEERRIVTHYDSFFVDPAAELHRLCEFAGLEAAPPHVRADLRHHEVGVGLEEADVSVSLRRLYRRLSEEAGVAVPAETPSEETAGRVQRLILDGAVATRHAEQRQEAIDRLEGRLAEAQETHNEMRGAEQSLRARNQSLEAELTALRRENQRLAALEERVDALTRSTDQMLDASVATSLRLETIESVGAETLERVREMRNAVGLKSRFRRSAKALARRSADYATPAARMAAQRLPEPAQNRLRRVKRAYDDGVAAERAKQALDRATDRLPAPARKVVDKGRAVARRAPAPLKRVAGRVRSVSGATDGPGRAGAAGTPQPRRRSRGAGRIPKGPPIEDWQAGFTALLAEHVAGDARWAVVAPGSPDAVRTLGPGAEATRFPVENGGPPMIDALSHVAVIEALRFDGHRFLALPEGSRPWFRAQPELRDHLSRNYRTVADAEGVGAVFDLQLDAAAEGHSVLAAINSVVGEADVPPAVLDCTTVDLAAELPGFTCFSPPEGEKLPYFDNSVEIVVIDDDGDPVDAERVASVAVIRLGADGACAVTQLGASAPDPTPTGPVAVLVPDGEDARWSDAVAARAAEIGARFEVVAGAPSAVGLADDTVVIVVEPGVVPVPGALGAAVRAVLVDPSGAVAAKVLDREGPLDAAGGFVFADGSSAEIAAGTDDVRAPWHEFVRPVCWAPGMVAARADLFNEQAPGSIDPAGILEWCGRLWAADHPVRYQPRVVAVRVAPRRATRKRPEWIGSGPRPGRPGDLSEGVWRYLIAHDDLEARTP